MNELFKEVLLAKVYDVVQHTPLDLAKKISQKLENQIYLKREDTLDVFSFKLRGAYNKIINLTQQEREAGVICASAGNHGQGVAFSAKNLGIKAIVVMPQTTPSIKVQATTSYGAQVVLFGDSYSDAEYHAEKLASENRYTYVHPFDDPLVIAGQGTVGKELVEDCPDMDCVFVPVGGGGLLAGIAVYLKQLKPNIKIVGVQPEDSNCMMQSVAAGKPVELDEVGKFADGVAVKKIGLLTFQVIHEFVDDFVAVATDEICTAMENIYEETRVVMEPAGALALAGMKKYLKMKKWQGKKLVAIASGANMNFQRLQFVAERALTGAKLEALYAIRLGENPGTLLEFCQKVMPGKSITEFNYRCKNRHEAYIFVGVRCLDNKDPEDFCYQLHEHNYKYIRLSDNELAKEHVRHMVGGFSDHVKNEVILRFQFPERQDALADFLAKMDCRWNISLFHYRSSGADFGQVLLGLEVEAKDYSALGKFLEDVDYAYVNETNNIAYKLFLNCNR